MTIVEGKVFIHKCMLLFGAMLFFLTGCANSGPPTPNIQTSQPLTSILPPTEMSTGETPTTMVSIATPSAKPFDFSMPRDTSHQLIFSNITENEQTIYSYVYETQETLPLFVFPPSMSFHEYPEIYSEYQGQRLKLQPEPGLHHYYNMFLSPDGTMLATIEDVAGGYPNYLHQIDLRTGEVVSVKLAENYQWTIPIPPERQISFYELVLEGFEPVSVTVMRMLDTVAWAPDSSGLILTLGDTGAAQIIYLARGSNQVKPLALDAPHNDVGLNASWSPNARFIAYSRDFQGYDKGIWLINLEDPDSAIHLAEFPTDAFYQVWQIVWAPNGKELYYVADYMKKTGVFQVKLSDGSSRCLLCVSPANGEEVFILIFGYTTLGEGLFISEHYYDSWSRETLDLKYHYIDTNSGEIQDLFQESRSVSISPTDPWARIRHGTHHQWILVNAETGEIIYGPNEKLEGLYFWSPDGHLLSGRYEDDLIIWDIEREEFITIAPELEGEKELLGWIPNLDK